MSQSLLEKFTFVKYSKENLSKALDNEFNVNINEFSNNQKHFAFLLEYLGEPNEKNGYSSLDAKTILTENEYVSQSYLNDFQAHYVLAHNNKYSKCCKRVHFFGNEPSDISKKSFLELHRNKDKEFWDSYLGFIIVRPIPNGNIGATLLKPYNNDNLRVYKSKRKYEINIFGIKLDIKTLIYIQHDSIVGACATSALFTCFHKVSKMFQTVLPNPANITIDAGFSEKSPGRLLPNREGLDIPQMCNSVHSLGLAAEVDSPEFDEKIKLFDNRWVQSILYAYSRVGIPVILGLKLDEGLHAVTVTGYRDVDISSKDFKKQVNRHTGKIQKAIDATNFFIGRNDNLALIYGITLKSYFIRKFYVHDDQVGPFARIEFKGISTINTAWWESTNIDKKLKAKYYASLVPLLHAIQIPFKMVIKSLVRVNSWLNILLRNEKLMWDVYLDYSNKYKNDLDKVDNNKYSEELFTCFPKFVWIAQCYLDGEMVFDIIFDPTEINQDNFIFKIIYRSDLVKDLMKEVLNDLKKPEIEEMMELINIQILNSFLESLSLPIYKNGNQ